MAVGMTQEDIALHGGRVMDAVRDLFEALCALRMDRRVKIVLHGNDDLHRLGTALGIAMAYGHGSGTGQWPPHEGLPFGLYNVLVTSGPRYAAQVLHDNPVVSFETSVRMDEKIVSTGRPVPYDGLDRQDGHPATGRVWLGDIPLGKDWTPPVVCESRIVTMADIGHRFGWASDSVKGR